MERTAAGARTRPAPPWTRTTPPTPITLLTVTGTVAALTQFVRGTVERGGQVGEACSDGDTLDDLETGACVDGTCAQVCYQGSTEPADIVHVGEPGCPFHPAGPGGPG